MDAWWSHKPIILLRNIQIQMFTNIRRNNGKRFYQHRKILLPSILMERQICFLENEALLKIIHGSYTLGKNINE
jgi:hypothetical protein